MNASPLHILTLRLPGKRSGMCLHLSKNGCFCILMVLKGQRQMIVSEEPLRRSTLDAEVADDSAKAIF